jgi:hypothetical protein
LITEDHVTGWLANWARLAGAQLKRFIIEFPFVAAKSYPGAAFSRSGLTNAVHQKYRLSRLVRDVRRHCLLQLAFPHVVFGQWQYNFFRGWADAR